MFAIKYTILLILLPFVKCENQTNVEPPKCTQNFTQLNNEPIMDIAKYCQSKRCIAKCCKEGEMSFKNRTTQLCKKISEISSTLSELNYSQVPIYNTDMSNEVGNLREFVNDSRLLLVHNEKFMDDNCAVDWLASNTFVSYYVLEDSTLMMEMPNYFERFSNKKHLTYCFELIWYQKRKTLKIGYRILREKVKESSDDKKLEFVSKYNRTALMISCFFMSLVLLVYAALPQLRNIVGMVLMAYTGTLMVAYLIKAIWVLDIPTCKNQIIYYYYGIISSFFWLNIMSWDIWWTIRGTRKCRPIHRQGELMKFIWYGVYAWGVPIVLTVTVHLVDQADLRHKPYIVKPLLDHCFASKYETLLYLYVPILILMVFNCALFCMTIYNLYMMGRNAKCLQTRDSKKNKKNENRFGVYVKIASLMGISWIVELVQLLVEDIDPVVYVIMNTYNFSIGVPIFFIFVVFQKDILMKLCKRFNINKGIARNFSSEQSTKSTNSQIRKRSGRSPTRQMDNTNIEMESIDKDCQ